MTAREALASGIRRVNGAPVVLAGMFVTTLLVALPLSIALRGMIEAHLGPSLAADEAASDINYDWWQEFSAQATGLGTTFVPSIAGFGAVLDNLSGLLDNVPLATTVAGATIAWLVIWSFLSGGVLDRYARGRATRGPGFFAACGVHFWRFLRLGALAWATYAVLFGYVHGWILVKGFEWLTRDVTVERTAFAIRVGCYTLFGLLVAICSLVFDYSRVRIVVEDRRSAVAALAAGIRFVRRQARTVAALYLMTVFMCLVVMGLYALLSPGVPGGGVAGWAALAIGEVYILARHYMKLLFYASEVSLFQGTLAHAAYTAAPAVVWPDSPAAESIANADLS
jgi:hypothetical protein